MMNMMETLVKMMKSCQWSRLKLLLLGPLKNKLLLKLQMLQTDQLFNKLMGTRLKYLFLKGWQEDQALKVYKYHLQVAKIVLHYNIFNAERP